MASASASSGSGAASDGKKARGKSTATTRKNLGFVGARRRQGGRWAAELRMPRTRERLWIGTFGTPKEAAHAYDAAIFCFYGDRVPKIRKINYPTAPRPNIPEDVRVGLNVPNIKAIAEMHAHSLADFIPPPPDQLPAAAASEEVVEVAPAPEVVLEAAPAPEVLVEAVPVPAVGASSVGVGAAPTTDPGKMIDGSTMLDDFDFDFDDLDRIMAFVSTE